MNVMSAFRCVFHTLIGAALALIPFAPQVLADSPASSPPVKVGMLLPLTGPYAAVGVDNQQGIELAKSELGELAKAIDIVLGDSKAEPTQSITEFRKMVEVDKVSTVFAFRGPVGMAVNPISQRLGIPILGGVGNKDFALTNQFAFQLWPRSDVEGEFLCKAMIDRKFTSVALLTVQDDYPVAVSTGFRDALRTSGGELSLDESILPGDSDFRSVITKLNGTKAQVIFANIAINQIAPFLKQLRQQGVDIPVYSNFWAGKKEVLEGAGTAANGLVFAEMSTSMAPLVAELKKRFNSSPSGATVSAYVATMMIAQAAERAADKTPQGIYSELLKLQEVKSRNGTFAIKDRFVQFPLALRVIHDGKIDPL